ncbi:MAG: DUF882 domain-containing protein [Syntrophales bacterium]|jgi:uncharacterized protein YcbK (DUF882 family)|nr:DUF882 domain-containing protein [Syntrophales bacterium]MDY0045056.1 DUF882 domain-containing protein [Syntrophales bacterium]
MSFLQKSISRRSFIRWTFSLALASQFPIKALEAHSPALHVAEKSISLFHIRTGEHFHDLYWAEGEFIPEALEAITFLFRDYHTGEVKSIDNKLIDFLYGIQTHTSSTEPIHVISGYRSRKTNELLREKGRCAVRNSFHLHGRAVDITLPSVLLSDLKKTAARLKTGGVGYYPHFHFVHVDTGPVRFWQK